MKIIVTSTFLVLSTLIFSQTFDSIQYNKSSFVKDSLKIDLELKKHKDSIGILRHSDLCNTIITEKQSEDRTKNCLSLTDKKWYMYASSTKNSKYREIDLSEEFVNELKIPMRIFEDITITPFFYLIQMCSRISINTNRKMIFVFR